MKTFLQNTALIITILTTANLFASSINFNDELYIDDIPFSTLEIYNNVTMDKNLTEFIFNDEEYIDDIPFDTECISTTCLYQEAISANYTFEDEKYITDIPFDTRCVSAKCRYNRAIKVEFNFEEEEFINDINIK